MGICRCGGVCMCVCVWRHKDSSVEATRLLGNSKFEEIYMEMVYFLLIDGGLWTQGTLWASDAPCQCYFCHEFDPQVHRRQAILALWHSNCQHHPTTTSYIISCAAIQIGWPLRPLAAMGSGLLAHLHGHLYSHDVKQPLTPAAVRSRASHPTALTIFRVGS